MDPAGRPARTRYTTSQIAAHWLTALLLALQWYSSVGVLRTHQMHPIYYRPAPFDLLLHRLHIYGGIAILGLVAARIVLRWRNGVPDPPDAVPRWTAVVAGSVHLLIYAVLAGLSLSGLVTTYVWFGAGAAHKLLVNLLYALVAVHVSAAIWHDLVHRAGTLARMLPLHSKQ